jgi:hypothetical protein
MARRTSATSKTNVLSAEMRESACPHAVRFCVQSLRYDRCNAMRCDYCDAITAVSLQIDHCKLRKIDRCRRLLQYNHECDYDTIAAMRSLQIDHCKLQIDGCQGIAITVTNAGNNVWSLTIHAR